MFQRKVLFRGFEATGGLGVYEVVDPRSPFFTFVGMHHVAEAARPAVQAGG